MRAVLQRVSSASVTVDGEVTGKIAAGLVVLLGIAPEDTSAIVTTMAEKILNLRIFHDDQKRMNRSLIDVAGAVLLISQFTLYADTRRGRRPGFNAAAPPDLARSLYHHMGAELSRQVPVEWGVFGAEMAVDLVNHGPVTIILDSDDR